MVDRTRKKKDEEAEKHKIDRHVDIREKPYSFASILECYLGSEHPPLSHGSSSKV
jgi:hypothetical protein